MPNMTRFPLKARKHNIKFMSGNIQAMQGIPSHLIMADRFQHMRWVAVELHTAPGGTQVAIIQI